MSARRRLSAAVAIASLVVAAMLAASPAAVAATYSETTGGVAHTWTNYTNAGGTEGPEVPAYDTIQIACKVTGFQVADGDTWWYQIASAPWSYSYYVSADAFYNNGATSGSLAGTPFVDPAVPTCGASSGVAETTGGVTHTWTNYTNAGGTEGPQIPAYTTVTISCRLQGFRVADGNTWWYLIGSSPWNNAFYASADAFYNNGATSGSLVGTPFVDTAVPDCGSSGGGPGPNPVATLAQGPAAPSGYRYAITLTGFPPSSAVSVECYDSVSPGGFYSFSLTTDANGNASTASYCYSGDGPDHWVVANGRIESNHASWGSGATGGGGGSGTGDGGSGTPTSPKIGTDHGISWAGYGAIGGNFTYVHGQWNVPKVDCSVIGANIYPGQVGEWVGIDGFGNSSLLQAGVIATCTSSTSSPSYALFWEAIPKTPVYGVHVTPGSSIAVNIRYHGTGSDKYSLAVAVNGVSELIASGTYSGAAWATAECIVEDTQFYQNGKFVTVVPYPNFGTLTFTSCSAARNGATSGIQLGLGGTSAYGVYAIQDDQEGNKATVSAPSSNGSTWSVYWHHA